MYIRLFCLISFLLLQTGTSLAQCLPETAPYFQDFENHTVGHAFGEDECWNFNSSTNAYSWEVADRPEVAKGAFTGPDKDHTLAPATGGGFLTVRASGSVQGDSAFLTSPLFDISGLDNPQFSFYYHKFGSQGRMPDLHVDVLADTSWHYDVVLIKGVTQDSAAQEYRYFRASLDGFGDQVRLRFRVGSRGCCAGDIAIDDFAVEETPPCPDPMVFDFVLSDSTSAQFTSDGEASTGEYEWGQAGFSVGTGISGAFSTDTFTVTGLTKASSFDVYMRIDCDTNGFSNWVGPLRFKTQCGLLSVPYSENFDTYSSGLPDCWQSIMGPDQRVSVNTIQSAASAPAQLFINNASNTQDTLLVISPAIRGLTNQDKWALFKAKSLSDNTTIIAGTINQAGDASSFSAVDTFHLSAFYQQYALNLSLGTNYNGLDGYIAFKHPQSEPNQIILIDDFKVEVKPACVSTGIDSINVQNVGENGAVISWITYEGVSWKVEAGQLGFTPGTGTSVWSSSENQALVAITGLNPDTYYEIYIQDSCLSGSKGEWVGPIGILTDCAAPIQPISLPFFEGFENHVGVNENDIMTSFNGCYGHYNLSYRFSDQGGRLRFITDTNYYAGGEAAATLDFVAPPPQTVGEILMPTVNTNKLMFTLNMSNYNSTQDNVILDFDYLHHHQSYYPGDVNKVWIRGTPDDSWIEVYDLYVNQGTNMPLTPTWFLEEPRFNEVRGINISSILQQNGQQFSAKTQLEFSQSGLKESSDYSHDDGYTFDNIYIDVVSCPVSRLAVDNVIDTAATIYWQGNVSDTIDYLVWIGDEAFYQGPLTSKTVGSRIIIDSVGVRLENLNSNHCYEYLIAPICNGDTLDFVGPYTFCTLCEPEVAPYTNNFDHIPSGTLGDFGGCWTGTSNTGVSNFGSIWSLPGINYSYWQAATGSPPYMGNRPAGPLKDATTGNGVYLYARADWPVLHSPLIDISNLVNPELVFAFHIHDFDELYNEGADSLLLDVYDGEKWHNRAFYLEGPQQESQASNWWTARVDLSPYNQTGYVRFRYTARITGDWTLAIDDFSVQEASSCPAPSSNISILSSSSSETSFKWESTTPNWTAFEIEFGENELGHPDNIRQLILEDSVKLNHQSATAYCFWVREICAAGDTSAWTDSKCFVSECGPFYAPYFNDFQQEQDGELASCFKLISKVGDGGTVSAYVQDNAGSKSMGVIAFGENSDAILISPHFPDLTDRNKRIEFISEDALGGNMVSIIVGTTDDNVNPSQFNPIDTIIPIGAAGIYSVNFDIHSKYNGTDEYIAFRGINPFFPVVVFVMDDFNYEVIPNCSRPNNLQLVQALNDSVLLKWQAGDQNAERWVIEYGPAGFTPGTGITIGADSNSFYVSGLSASSDYCFRVAEICPDGEDTSYYSSTLCLTTACDPIQAPYFENFENFSRGHYKGHEDCWHFVPEDSVRQTLGLGEYNQDYTYGVFKWSVRVDPSSRTDNLGLTHGPNRDNTFWPLHGGTYLATNIPFTHYMGSVDSTSILSPLIDLSGLQNPELEYSYHLTQSTPELHVDIWNGTRWEMGVHALQSGQQDSADHPYKDTILDLSSYSGEIIQIRFKALAVQPPLIGRFFSIGIDDVRISDPLNCEMPENILLDTVNSHMAEVSWDGNANSYLIEYGLYGFEYGTGITVSTNSTNYTFTNLNENECYQAYIKSVCGSDTSVESGIIFCSQPAVRCDDFDQYLVGNLISYTSPLFRGFLTQGNQPTSYFNGDAEVDSKRAYSGSNSLRLHQYGPNGFSAVLADLGVITSGAHALSFMIYVPGESQAFYSIQQEKFGTYGIPNVRINLQGGGARAGLSNFNTFGTFSYTSNQWNEITHIIDLDLDTTWILVNGNDVGVGWNFLSEGNLKQFYGVHFSARVIGVGVDPYRSLTHVYDFNVDDFCVEDFCRKPDKFSMDALSCDSANLYWRSNRLDSVSMVQYGLTGFSPGSGSIVGELSQSYELKGLNPGTSYDVYIANVCGDDTTDWVGPFTFITDSMPQPIASFSDSSVYTATTQTIYFSVDHIYPNGMYVWDFGDGNVDTGEVVTHTYSLPNDNYAVKLTVITPCGSADTIMYIGTTIGIYTNELDRSIQVYPNPTSGLITLNFAAQGSSHAFIRIMDTKGKLIYNLEKEDITDAYTTQVDLSALASGVYLLELKTGTMTAIRKIIVQ